MNAAPHDRTAGDAPNGVSLHIGGVAIGPGAPPFVIAELSGNHNGSLERALALVDAAADAGVAAIKLQTYTADTMTIDVRSGAFHIDDPDSLWAGRSLHELYQEASTPWAWHAPLLARCRERGVLGFSSPFDISAVDFLETLDVPAYKIASFELVDLALIRRCAATGKPLIMSTGMATVAEIDDAVRAARDAGCRDLVLLKCTSAYPSPPERVHLRTIPHLRQLFATEVGLSDHTLGLGVAVAGVTLGATVVEKHFTLRRADGGVDSAFSMEPEEMAQLVTETRRAWQALGEVTYGASAIEATSRSHRRSLYVVADVRAGEVLTAANVRAIRPGLGLAPKFLDTVLGMRARVDLARGTPLSFDLLG